MSCSMSEILNAISIYEKEKFSQYFCIAIFAKYCVSVYSRNWKLGGKFPSFSCKKGIIF